MKAQIIANMMGRSGGLMVSMLHYGSRNPSVSHVGHCVVFLGSASQHKGVNTGMLSVQEIFLQLIGWLGVRLGVSPVGMVYCA